MLFLFWLLITFSLKVENLIVGCAAAILATFIFNTDFLEVKKLTQPKRYFWGLVYIIFFLWECIKANFDVAYRVLHPDLPIHPGIVKIKLNIHSEMARTMLANSITMTPGTITVDIIDDFIYIHWINITSNVTDDYSYQICGKFEKYIGRIFE